MALEGTQSGVLQHLGVSYGQLVDYSSKEYLATLVRPPHDLLPCQLTQNRHRFNSALWH